MSNTIEAIELQPPLEIPECGVVALFGSDRFLATQALQTLCLEWGGEDAEFSVRRIAGESATWIDVRDELSSGSLFASAGPRLIVIEDADDFVKLHRPQLEELAERKQAHNVLILCVTTWPANTRLFKRVDKAGLQIHCDPPQVQRGRSKSVDNGKIVKWLSSRAETEYGVRLDRDAARLMIEMSECNFGQFDQQLAKLSCCVPPGQGISENDVRVHIGGWKSTTAWQMMDAALDGDVETAMTLLNRLLQSGEHPLALFGQISWSLRRYGLAMQHADRARRQGKPVRLRECAVAAGFKTWGGELDAAERRIARLGPQRTRKLYRWLLEADLAMKGTHSHESRAASVIEQLLIRIAMNKEAKRPAAAQA